jgi:5-methylcytosine-specific restriction endonuclease McrA
MRRPCCRCKRTDVKFGLGSQGYCRACAAIYRKEWAAKEIVKNGHRVLSEKKCGRCKEVKQISEFYTNKSSVDNAASFCKPCHKAYYYAPAAYGTPRWWSRRCSHYHLKGVKGKEAQKLFESNPFCHYCAVSLTAKECHLDHKTPRSRAGKSEISNICVTCKECNRMKDAMTELEFEIFLREFYSRMKNKYELRVVKAAEHYICEGAV